jgi:hypothetical protein
LFNLLSGAGYFLILVGQLINQSLNAFELPATDSKAALTAPPVTLRNIIIL